MTREPHSDSAGAQTAGRIRQFAQGGNQSVQGLRQAWFGQGSTTRTTRQDSELILLVLPKRTTVAASQRQLYTAQDSLTHPYTDN